MEESAGWQQPAKNGPGAMLLAPRKTLGAIELF